MIKDKHIHTEGFAHRVALAFDRQLQDRLREFGTIDGIHKLVALRAAMYEVAANIDDAEDPPQTDPSTTLHSGIAFAILSSIHRGTVASTAQLRRRLPLAWHTDILSSGAQFSQVEHRLREKALQLAKEELIKDMRQQLQQDAAGTPDTTHMHNMSTTTTPTTSTPASSASLDMTKPPARSAPTTTTSSTSTARCNDKAPTVPPRDGDDNEDEALRLSRRNSIKRRLAQFHRRVQTCGLHYLRTVNDEVVSEPQAMAEALSAHWQGVFQEQPIDDTLLSHWFDPAERRGL
jgi:hypothetical protein